MARPLVLLLILVAGTLRAQTGLTAVHANVPGSPALHGITPGDSGLVAVGDNGTILFSADGVSWQIEPSGVTDNLASVAFGSGRYVAVGDHGRMLTSLDGEGWAPVSQTVTAQRINGISSNGSRFIAVGEGGASLSSPDGLTWTSFPSGTTQALRAVTAGRYSWVCVGAGGTGLYIDPFGGGWQPLAMGTTADLNAVAATYSSAEDIVGAGGPYPTDAYDAGGANGAIYGIIVEIPRGQLPVYSAVVNPGSDIRAIVGGGLWSNGGLANSFSGNITADAETLAFDSAGNGFRAPTDARVPAGWRQSDSQLAAPINGACSDSVRNAVYLVGAGGAIYRQVEIYRSGLANFSVLSQVGAGSPAELGLVVGSGAPKSVLFRAAGPALMGFGIGSPLAQPQLSVFGASGALLGSNQGWAAQLAATMAQTQAFPFVSGSADAALLESLPAGTVVASVTAPAGQRGAVLTELYDADPAVDGTATITNASALVQLGAGGSVTVGYVIAGPAQQSSLFRVVGPGLGGLGVADPLPDPIVELQGGFALSTSAGALTAASQSAGAFPLPSGGQNPAFLGGSPGRFTATIRSASGAAGTVLVEVYLVPLPLGPVSGS